MSACPALLISAPASGQGKTTVTAALARHHRARGRRVRVFKTGADFLDPMVLEQASGHPVYQLDLWLGGAGHCQALLADAAGDADLILIEGVMGLYDGEPSSADLAVQFGVPVLAVVDASAMAQTFGAVVHGLAHFDHQAEVVAVMANGVGSSGHGRLLHASLPEDVAWYGALARDPAMALPQRHLGLVQAQELDDLDRRLDHLGQAVASMPAAKLPAAVNFAPIGPTVVEPHLRGVRIAVARDAAFSFVYPANLDLLRAAGAQVVFFSPLADAHLPDCDAVYLPGGYPELHLSTLQKNSTLRADLRAHQAARKPLVAECGGMLYLLQDLSDSNGQSAAMTGLLAGRGCVHEHLRAIAFQSVDLAQGELRGHTFHHSSTESMPQPKWLARCPNGGAMREPVYCTARTFASYVHWYFPSNPAAASALFAP